MIAADQLAQALTAAGVEVLTYVPEELVPGPGGVVVLVPAEDYLKPADTFADEWELTLEAHLLVDLVDNQAAAEDLDALVVKTLTAVSSLTGSASWETGTLRRPGPLTANQWLAHGTTLPLSTITTLTTQE